MHFFHGGLPSQNLEKKNVFREKGVEVTCIDGNSMKKFNVLVDVDPVWLHLTAVCWSFRFPPGSLVWAKISGYPWWPSMVCHDPSKKLAYRSERI